MIGTLKVSPEEMQAASAELAGYVRTMSGCFETMKRIMNGTDAYWNGEAAQAHRALYDEQVPKTEEFIARCNEHVADLNTMAGVYSQAEQTATAKAEELPVSNL